MAVIFRSGKLELETYLVLFSLFGGGLNNALKSGITVSFTDSLTTLDVGHVGGKIQTS